MFASKLPQEAAQPAFLFLSRRKWWLIIAWLLGWWISACVPMRLLLLRGILPVMWLLTAQHTSCATAMAIHACDSSALVLFCLQLAR
jgi:hypothetical protein